MLGWNTGFDTLMPPGHEILTAAALRVGAPGAPGTVTFQFGGRAINTTLNPGEVSAIVEGNRAVDVDDLRRTQSMISAARRSPLRTLVEGPLVAAGRAAYMAGEAAGFLVHSVSEGQQKRHALRRNPSQDWRVALGEIIQHLRSLHARVLATTAAMPRMRVIGETLHLIQDSYCPAHTERSAARCIQYVRNYGGYDTPIYQRGGAGREHRYPSDPRDSVRAHPAEANEAVLASRQYLEIVCKHVYGVTNSDARAIAEAAREFDLFVQQHFRAC